MVPEQPRSFRDLLAAMERRRKTLEVHAAEAVPAIAAQFASKNVTVEQRSLPPGEPGGFVVVRGPDGEFLGSTDLASFDALIAPDTDPPWERAEQEAAVDVFDFLDDTLFTSFDHRQMLATAREIEERAWRTGTGSLYAGFQDRKALRDQRPVYDAFREQGDVAVHVYASDEWDVEWRAVRTHEPDGEIGVFWFVLYDDERGGANSCALLAEERTPGAYYGFWTYDPAIVDELVAHVRTTYGPS